MGRPPLPPVELNRLAALLHRCAAECRHSLGHASASATPLPPVQPERPLTRS